MTICIAPLGRDYNKDKTGIGAATALRCDIAYEEAQRLSMSNVVVLAIAPGSEAARGSGPTMASMMEDYFVERRIGIPRCVNHVERKVWGTLAEMRWVLAACPRAITYVFVAAPRHDRRVRYIAKTFFPDRYIRVVTSAEPAVPLWNEALAYTKLFFVQIGLEYHTEAIRRRLTRPTAR